MGATQRGARFTPAQQVANARAQQVFSTRAAILSNDVLLTVVSRSGPQAQPTRLVAMVTRANAAVSIAWKQW